MDGGAGREGVTAGDVGGRERPAIGALSGGRRRPGVTGRWDPLGKITRTKHWSPPQRPSW
jgi:hypothetical protein